VIHTLQALLVLGPIVAYFVTKRMCIALQRKDREIALHGYESGRIVRLPGGEYIEVHQPVDEYERFKLADFDTYEPLVVRPNAQGRIPWHENVRASVSRWFFEDRLTPVSQAELDAALAHQHHDLDHIAAEEDLELQGAHERAGVPDAPHKPIDDGHNSETAVRPSNVIVPDPEPGTKSPRNREKESDQ
jgi:ubiquinol-cytochrome c reductase cytochrome b subunit